jgi:hypothetical protein
MKKLWRYLLSSFEFAAHVLDWAYPAIMMLVLFASLYIWVSVIIQANEVFKQERIKREQQLNTKPCQP